MPPLSLSFHRENSLRDHAFSVRLTIKFALESRDHEEDALRAEQLCSNTHGLFRGRVRMTEMGHDDREGSPCIPESSNFYIPKFLNLQISEHA